MSFGAKAQKTNESAKNSGTTTQTIDPRQSQALYENLERAKTLKPYEAYTGPLVADFNSDQTAAQNQAREAAGANIGGGLLNDASTAAQGVAAYQPTGIYGSQVDRNNVRDVGYADIGGEAIDRFMNPYEDAVVSRSMADLDSQRARAQTDNSAMATKLGAFRGTGLFNARDRTDETFAKASGDTAGQLRYQGFNTALGAAQADAARRAQADAANQGVDASVTSQNANLAQNTQLANQGADERAQALRLSASQALSGLSDQERQQKLENLALLGGVGDARQANEQAVLDAMGQERNKAYGSQLEIQQLLNQSLGLVPQSGTTTTNGQSSGKSSGTGVSASASYGGK